MKRAGSAGAASIGLVVALSLLDVSGSQAAQPTSFTLGETRSGTVLGCGNPFTMIQAASDSGGAPYTVPYAGVITSFSSLAGAGSNQEIRLALFGAPTAGVFPVLATSATFPLTPSALNTFPVRIPVQPGWLLGGRFSAGTACLLPTGKPTDDVYVSSTGIDGATVSASNLGDYHVNLSAVLEPDGDGDGYGDTTQDACPQSALSHLPCVPQTMVTKRPAKRTRHRKVKLAFTSSVAGSTFTCSLDGKRARPCSSPYKRKVGLGRHTIIVAATSPVGIADESPEIVQFKVLARKRH